LTAGSLGDRLGAKRLFIAGFAFFTISSVACGLAPTFAVLIVARTVQGAGAAILVPCSLALLNHAFHDAKERSRAVGLLAAGASTALAAGPVVGGALIALVGWRGIFFINVPIGLVGVLMTIRYLEETPKNDARRLDLAGQLAAIVMLGSLAGSVIEAGVVGWTNHWVLAGLVVFIVAGVVFIVVESRRRDPMLPMTLFQNRTFRSASTVGLLVNVAFYGLLFIVSLFFQREQGFSALKAGLAFVPMTASIMGANLVAGRYSRRFGDRVVIIVGEVMMASACLGLVWVGRGTSYWALAAQLFVLGAGLGLVVPPMTSSLLGSIERSRSGVATASLFALRQSGSVIGVALFGSLLVGHFFAGLHRSLVISAVLLVIGAIIAVEVGATQSSSTRPEKVGQTDT
jgi:DHA2 family methylenomycin A resistance protein-like MFS transporter